MTPALLLMLLVIVQFALWSHATHIAQAAASQGLATARGLGGTAPAGTASARRLLAELGGGPLSETTVTTTRGGGSASVRVTGTATKVVPLLSLPVHAEASGPLERFSPDTTGGR